MDPPRPRLRQLAQGVTLPPFDHSGQDLRQIGPTVDIGADEVGTFWNFNGPATPDTSVNFTATSTPGHPAPNVSEVYISLGDGGGGGDPQANGQDRTTLLGSILRIDVDGGSPYAIPGTNPYRNHLTFREELWNYGLRNAWRFSFDRSTGDMYIADVGQGSREEINFQPAASTGGENYGWNVMEGSQCFNAGSCNQSGLTLPVHDYDHSGGACSITGGLVYRGSAIPALAGTYFYADYCAGWVRSFRLSGGQASDHFDWADLAVNSPTSFGQDAAGELYIVGSGTVWRIVEASE